MESWAMPFVHDVAVVWVAAKYVGYYLAEGMGIQAFVYVLDGIVYIFLGGRDAAHHVAVVVHCVSLFVS